MSRQPVNVLVFPYFTNNNGNIRYTSIPITKFKGDWDDNTGVVTKYSFVVNVIDKKIVLSHEHNEFGWFTYEEAMKLLKWDSMKRIKITGHTSQIRKVNKVYTITFILIL